MWIIFEVFIEFVTVLIEFVTVLFLFYVLVFWLEGMWYSSSWGVWAGIEPASLHCIGGWSPNWIAREVPHWSMNNPVPPVTLFLESASPPRFWESQDSGHEVTILRKNKRHPDRLHRAHPKAPFTHSLYSCKCSISLNSIEKNIVNTEQENSIYWFRTLCRLVGNYNWNVGTVFWEISV